MTFQHNVRLAKISAEVEGDSWPDDRYNVQHPDSFLKQKVGLNFSLTLRRKDQDQYPFSIDSFFKFFMLV